MTAQTVKEFGPVTALNATSKDALSKLVKAWESKNAQRAARGAGLGLMAVSLAACGGGEDAADAIRDGDAADFDKDGVPDAIDRFPTDGDEWADTDGDGKGDNSDFAPDDPTVTLPPTAFKLTVGQDTLGSTVGIDYAGNNTFVANVEQNELGEVVNTLETGDVVDGGLGVDTLDVTLVQTAMANEEEFAPAVAPSTRSVEIVNVKVQSYLGQDWVVNGSTIDAGDMLGVRQWWSDNSRSFLQIEDITSNPEDTTFGMKNTDPNVSYNALFTATAVAAGAGVKNSVILIEVSSDGSETFDGFNVDRITFTREGVTTTLDTVGIKAADTLSQLAAAVDAALSPASGLNASVVDGKLVITDPAGGKFTAASTILNTEGNAEATVKTEFKNPDAFKTLVETDVVLNGAGKGGQGGVLNIGAMDGNEGVGQFNVLATGADSHLLAMTAINSLNPTSLFPYDGEILEALGVSPSGWAAVHLHLNGAHNHNNLSDNLDLLDASGYLEVVNVTGSADLTIGWTRNTLSTDGRAVATNQIRFGNERPSDVLGKTGESENRYVDESGYSISGAEDVTAQLTTIGGLVDVRTLDASSFTGDLNVGIQLTSLDGDRIDSYFREEREVTEKGAFSYTGGSGDDIMTFSINENMNQDVDFSLNIEGGSGDDRFNFVGNEGGTEGEVDGCKNEGEQADNLNDSFGLWDKSNASLDGGLGFDTVEIMSSTGVTGKTGEIESDDVEAGDTSTAWASFSGVERLVVAGQWDTYQNIKTGNMLGLQEIVIATDMAATEGEGSADGDPGHQVDPSKVDFGHFHSDVPGGWDFAYGVPVDTTIAEMEAGTDVTISGKNQTLGSFANDFDQGFDVIEIWNAQGTDATITLDNTGRMQAMLSVEQLLITGIDESDANSEDTVFSNLDSVTLVSAGVRNVSNVVRNFEGSGEAGVSTLDIEGTQDLSLHVSVMDDDTPRVIDATGLTGNRSASGVLDGASLNLTVSGDVINGTGSVAGSPSDSNVTIKGTLNASDELNVYGLIESSANVSGFEEIIFGDNDLYVACASEDGVSGTFDARNTLRAGLTNFRIHDVVEAANNASGGEAVVDIYENSSYITDNGDSGSGDEQPVKEDADVDFHLAGLVNGDVVELSNFGAAQPGVSGGGDDEEVLLSGQTAGATKITVVVDGSGNANGADLMIDDVTTLDITLKDNNVDLYIVDNQKTTVNITSDAGETHRVFASDAGDEINGGEANETIYAGAGKDVISGGAGKDLIYLESDTGSGGSADTVVFDITNSDIDEVNGYEPEPLGSGSDDVLSFTGVGASTWDALAAKIVEIRVYDTDGSGSGDNDFTAEFDFGGGNVLVLNDLFHSSDAEAALDALFDVTIDVAGVAGAVAPVGSKWVDQDGTDDNSSNQRSYYAIHEVDGAELEALFGAYSASVLIDGSAPV